MRHPFFSICIPQYNRTDFLIEACRSFRAQIMQDFEICVSDDCSNDGQEQKLLNYLQESGLRHVYRRNCINLRYDGNLRSAIELSSGRYVLLMGNDDALANPRTLADLRDHIEWFEGVDVAITNYRELLTGRIFERVSETGLIGSGPAVAAGMFRNYSFVSGIVFDGDKARALASDIVDGSEMYQMYIGTRLIAEGGRLVGIAECCIRKDIQIPGRDVDSYRQVPRLSPCPITRRPLPMGRLLEVVGSGLRPCVSPTELNKLLFRIAVQLYTFTYAFWGVEYRRVQSRPYALGVLMALSPADITGPTGMSKLRAAALWPVYLTCCATSLLTPIWLFDRSRSFLYKLAKRSR